MSTSSSPPPPHYGSVLSVQSNVVHGYVGNKCATWALQLLGLDVLPMNTVEVASHSGYPVFRGTKFETEHFAALTDALRANRHDNYDYVLSGYMGKPDAVLFFSKYIAQLRMDKKERNEQFHYVFDPVLGDNGKLYLPPEMIELYRAHLLPLATITTPNQFELEQLTMGPGQTIASIKDAVRAAERLGVPEVVVTSLRADDCPGSRLQLLAYDGRRENATTAHIVAYPVIDAHFTGTGDFFAALLLGARAQKPTAPLHFICACAVAVLQRVLRRTKCEAERKMGTCVTQSIDEKRTESLRAHELRLVQSRDDIVHLPLIDEAELAELGISVSEIAL